MMWSLKPWLGRKPVWFPYLHLTSVLGCRLTVMSTNGLHTVLAFLRLPSSSGFGNLLVSPLLTDIVLWGYFELTPFLKFQTVVFNFPLWGKQTRQMMTTYCNQSCFKNWNSLSSTSFFLRIVICLSIHCPLFVGAEVATKPNCIGVRLMLVKMITNDHLGFRHYDQIIISDWSITQKPPWNLAFQYLYLTIWVIIQDLSNPRKAIIRRASYFAFKNGRSWCFLRFTVPVWESETMTPELGGS